MTFLRRLGIAAIVAALLFAAGLAGWMMAHVHSTPVVSPNTGRIPIASVAHQSLDMAPALEVLADKALPVALEAAAVDVVAEPVAIPIDRAVRQSLKAIVGAGRGAVLILSPGENETQPRRLKLGQEVYEGWVLSQITSQELQLTRGDEKVSVQIFEYVIGDHAETGITGHEEGEVERRYAASIESQ